MKNNYCMNCHSQRLRRFINLGLQPNGNAFPREVDFASEVKFPFVMMVCEDCWQVQLEEFPPVDIMFNNHPYITGLNEPIVNHFEELVCKIIQQFELKPNSLVLDIGANDGTLLSKFRNHEMRVIGIDPCKNTGQLARESGITVFEAFWDNSSAQAMKKLGIFPDLIMATYVFYHMEDIHSFIQGLATIMGPKTIFCAQCVYLKDLITKFQFDHFYHEHTMIHAIGPLRSLFAKYNLRLLDVDFYSIHGGSFVLYVGREQSEWPTTTNIQAAITAEKNEGIYQLDTYQKFTNRVEQNRENLLSLLKEIKNSGKKVFGLGAPLKGSTLLNYCDIGPDLITCLTEVNQFKIGRYSPGTHIPIVSEDSIDKHPDYYLLLSWNFVDFFIEKYKNYLNSGGMFILPHPTVRILGKDGFVKE